LNIVNDLNGDRKWFYGELDKVIKIINEELVVGADTVPIIFRPFHEMNGNWFWWGSSGINSTNYKALYALLVDYVRARTKSVLFCWSPNTPMNMSYYPGDNYVDILGVDAYEINAAGLRSDLAQIVDYAQAHNKVAVLSETGNRTKAGAAEGDNAARYWKDTVLPAILNDPSGKAQKIAWVLTWINASWSFPYVPHSGSSTTAKQSFIDFKTSLNVVFASDLLDMYSPLSDGPVANEEELKGTTDDIQVYPTPTNDFITVKTATFRNSSRITIYDTSGKKIYEQTIFGEELTIYLRQIAKPGLYLLNISDFRRSVSRKIIVN
jgi:hypothetical protein